MAKARGVLGRRIGTPVAVTACLVWAATAGLAAVSVVDAHAEPSAAPAGFAVAAVVNQDAGRCPHPAPSTAEGFQELFDAKNDRTWSGGDQATSAVLPDGRILWLFGDTIQGDEAVDGGYAAGWRLVHNSFLLQDGGCLTAVNGPDGAEVVPDADNGDHYWPQQALVDGDRLVVLALRVRPTGPGGFDFRISGVEAAVFTLPAAAHEPPRFQGMERLPSSDRSRVGPLYGVATVTDGGYHYLYGTRRTDQPLAAGRLVHVARVPAGSLTDAGSWTYWTGTQWSADPAAATPVAGSPERGWSTSFSVHRTRDGLFRVVTKENDFLGSDVVVGLAASPTGPFTRTVVTHAPSFAVRGELVYLAAGHPEAVVDGGVLGTLSRNNTDLGAVAADADLYKPQFFVLPAG